MKKILFASLLIAAFASCTQELDFNKKTTAPSGKRIVTARLSEIETRTEFNEGRTKLAWTNGDKIGIFTDADDNTTATYNSGSTVELVVNDEASLLTAYYPFSGSGAANAVTMNIPTKQTQASAGVFNGSNLPMVAQGTIVDDIVDLTFNPLASVLGFNVYGSTNDEKVVSIMFVSNSAEHTAIAGESVVDITSASPTFAGEEGVKMITVTLDTPVSAVGSKPADTRAAANQVFLVVKKAVYPAGTDIIVKTDKEFYRFRTSSPIDCSAADYITMNLNLAKGDASEVAYGDSQFLLDLLYGGLLNLDWKNFYADPDIFEGPRIDGTIPCITSVKQIGSKYYVIRIDNTTHDSKDYRIAQFPETLDLQNLTELNFHDNNTFLNGKALPKVWNTPNATTIHLGQCHMTGPIPEGLVNLPNATSLVLAGNSFTSFPETLSLPKIGAFHVIGMSSLTGTELPQNWNTPAMTDLRLSSCGFVGTVPEGILNSTNLTTLQNIFSGNKFSAFPASINLAKVEKIDLRGYTSLTGAELPASWNTPKLKELCIASTGICSTIPDGLAASPELHTIFADKCFLYGSLPHVWGDKLEVIIINHEVTGVTEGFESGWNFYINYGYLIPRELDVLNVKSQQGDYTQLKIGFPHYQKGYEYGWGQERYETAGGTVGDLSTWDARRLYNVSPSFCILLPDGEHNMKMFEWNQADADAATASIREAAKAAAAAFKAAKGY